MLLNRGAAVVLSIIVFGAFQATPSPSLAANSLDQFVPSLATWFRFESRSSNPETRTLLLNRIPILNEKLLQLSRMMYVFAGTCDRIRSLDGHKMSSVSLNYLNNRMRYQQNDLENALKDVADAIKPLETPLTEFDLRLAIKLENVFGSPQQAVQGAMIVSIDNVEQLASTISELREVSWATQQLAMDLDELRQTGRGPLGPGRR